MQFGEPSKSPDQSSFIAIEIEDIFRNPAAHVWVQIEHEDGTLFAVRTDADGRARIQNVVEGEYAVRPLLLPRPGAAARRSAAIRG